MATKPVSDKTLRRSWKAFEAAGWNQSAASKALKMPRTTLQQQLTECRQRLKLKVPKGARPDTAAKSHQPTDAEIKRLWAAYEANGFVENATARALGLHRSTLQAQLATARLRLGVAEPDRLAQKDEALVRLLKKPGGSSLQEASAAMGLSRGQVLDKIEGLGKRQFNLQRSGDQFSIHASPVSGISGGRQVVHESDKNGWYRFGLVADSHIGSKYARTEVLNDIYDEFERQGIERVYHCGNMIDGFKSGVNDHDVVAAGMDEQIALLAKDYPRRKGITTYAVSGDDHEGWFAQKMGIDIGKRIEQTMRDPQGAARTDWVDLGYMECFVTLKHAVSGKQGQLLVCHPGGGSSYADSYVVQKIVESYEGGEKPGIAVFGHYHKNLTGEYRNVWYCLVPCTQDQTPWARKKRLRYVIGGQVVEAWQRPETGAFERFRVEQLRYFNRGYYNDRWRPAGLPVLPTRTRQAVAL